MAKGNSIVAELAQLTIRKPILVYAPPYDLGLGQDDNAERPEVHRDSSAIVATGGPDGGGSGSADRGSGTRGNFPGSMSFGSQRMALNVEDMWVDVGFRISPQGQVENLQVLRSKGSQSWAKPLLKSIAGRRYTPANPTSPTSYRRERYTFTSALEAGSGSKAKQHSPNARVEYFDLSDMNSTN